MLMQEIWEKVKTENARAKIEHGLWRDLPSIGQGEAIAEEFEEWQLAYFAGDVEGEHGEIRELFQLMNVCARRIQFLTGEADA